jgi:hypothetical protein
VIKTTPPSHGDVVLVVNAERDAGFQRLLAQGSIYSSALQLSNVSAVLPFLCAQWGSLWVAGLLYPAFSVGIIAGWAASPFIMGRSRHRKHLVFAGGTTSMAVLTVCAVVSAQNRLFIDAVFIVASTALGIAKGISDGAHAELVSAKVSGSRRSQLILGEYAISAIVVGAATLAVVPLLSRILLASPDAIVLWLGAAGMIGAAVAALFVGPIHAHSGRIIPRISDIFREGIRVVRSQRWFRRYTLTQLLFVPITLGTTFYVLYAPERNQTGGRLTVLVISASVGLLIGSYLWRAVYRSAGVRGMLVGSSLTAITAAVICTLAQVSGIWSHAWVHGLVLALAAAADQAVYAAAIAWMGTFADEHDRPTLMGFAAALVALASSLVGVLLGGIAQNTSAIWPVTVVLALSLVAVGAAARTSEPGLRSLAR